MQSLTFALTLLVLILSIIAHEVAHGYAADKLGDPTARLAGRLTLNPIPHIDLMGSVLIPILLVLSGAGVLFGWAKSVPYNPYNLKNQRWGEAIVAVAGSATNLLLALIFGLIVRFGAALPAGAVEVAATICFVNLFLGLFNLIPFPPMDGYTVLRGVMPFRLSYELRAFENRIRSWGTASIILILIVFSYVLAAPFYTGVLFLFKTITGAVL